MKTTFFRLRGAASALALTLLLSDESLKASGLTEADLMGAPQAKAAAASGR